MGKITKKGANLGKSQLLNGANPGKTKPKRNVTIRFLTYIVKPINPTSSNSDKLGNLLGHPVL